MYFPTLEASKNAYPSFFLKSGNEKIKIWMINPGKPAAIIYFGGNGEAVEYNIEIFERIFPAHTSYIVNYRGFGGSSGNPSELALFTDAVTIYDHISAQHNDISVIGRSLGSGIAAYLASKRKNKKLILITPYDSMENVAKDRYPLFPVSLLLKDKYPIISYVSSIQAETLVLIAEFDEIIRRKRTDNLVNQFNIHHSQKILTIHVISGSSHNSISSDPAYEKLLSEFMLMEIDPCNFPQIEQRHTDPCR